MKDFWIAFGIVLMVLPILYYLRLEYLTARVLVIPLYGEIDGYKGYLISQALEDSKDYDAYILEIDSPGGTLDGVLKVIYAIRDLKNKNKTVVAIVEGEALSGAYWIASYCDKIFVNNLSLLGSVGVSASYLNFAGLLDMLNITYVEIYNGSMKEMGSPFKRPSENEVKRLREIVNKIYNYFLADIKRNRNLSEKSLEIVGTSDIFLGEEAVEIGLADEVGGIEKVKEFLKERLEVQEVKLEYPKFI